MNDGIKALLEDVSEFLADQADVKDGSYGEQTPNRAMSLQVLVDDTLAHWPKEREYVERGGWVSVHDRMPEDGEKVLATWEDGWQYVAFWIGGEWRNSVHTRTSNQGVLWWMPFPRRPCEGRSE